MLGSLNVDSSKRQVINDLLGKRVVEILFAVT